METNKEDFDKELNDILDEMPLDEKRLKVKKQKPRKEIKKPVLNFIKSKRKGIIIIIGVLALLFVGFMLCGSSDCPIQQSLNKTCEGGDQLFSTIKQQILTNGYAEITGEGTTMKLSPYTG